ncbi:MAG: hypothetical protein IKB25_00970 [Lentisphaeria bacterium]|nr:hypothetical protein [Lentisphaeria bacterium]
MSSVLDEISEFLKGRYQISEYPALHYQFEKWHAGKPFSGKKLLDGTPVFANTLLKYAALIAGGADLTIGYSENIPYDPEIIRFLESIGVKCLSELPVPGTFDVIMDCNGVYRDCKPKYGFVELTRSGAYRFAGTKEPVIMVDDSRIKAIETCLGTGEGFLRGMNHLGYADVSGKKIVVFGCGKVGRGVVFYAGRAGADVFAVDDPAMVENHIGGELVSRFEREKVLELLKNAWCVVSCTGKALALADEEYLQVLRNGDQIMVNMGVEDEWGSGIPADRVLNRKQPLNFILPEPTLLRYIDPTMALHSHAALELIQSDYLPGIRKASLSVEQEYWQIVEKHGMISGELSAAGL